MHRIGSEINTAEKSIFFGLKDCHETNVRSYTVEFSDGNGRFSLCEGVVEASKTCREEMMMMKRRGRRKGFWSWEAI